MSVDAQHVTKSAHYPQKHKNGSWKWTNHLAHESSPYLLQHAHNPVNWYPWGQEAFDESRRTGKPIFLSIGYSTCYWCHVMERQSFENPAIAAVLNEHFISIKVDREERPDVDDIYMAAVQLITGSGGWPMSVFLTAPTQTDVGLKPFYAGTYFPPQDGYGKPGFPTLLKSLSNAWNTQHAQVIEQADRIVEAVVRQLTQQHTPSQLSEHVTSDAVSLLMRIYEPTDGGFGKAPKFPQPANLLFLLEAQKRLPHAPVAKALIHTLDRMARGGMYDQVGGGFHRYSTDGQWLVPHFEKMLYDNGQLAETYIKAHEQKLASPTDDPQFYARVARRICDYVLLEMLDQSGGFWSAQDAEVDAKEGLNYLWVKKEIHAAIKDPKGAALALQMYGFGGGTNFQDPHHAKEPRRNVLFLPQPLTEVAREQGMSLEALLQVKKKIDAQLYATRQTRKQPGTDEKMLVAWNGMMIAGMANTGRVLGDARYIQAAAKAANAILTHMQADDGSLYRTMSHGHNAKIPAFLEDYAFFIHGLIELYRADGNDRWLNAATQLDAVVEKQFVAEHGGYFDTLADQADLFVRTRSMYDGALPSGNSQMVHNLIDLAEVTGDVAYHKRATRDLQAAVGAMAQSPVGLVHMVHAQLRLTDQMPVVSSSPTRSTVGRQVVDVKIEPQEVTLADQPVKLTLTLDIGLDYHLNAHHPGAGDDALIPTTVTLEQGEGLTLQVDYPQGIKRQYPFGDQPIQVYEGHVEIELTLTPSSTGLGEFSGEPVLVLQYQVCTEQSCLKPQTVTLPVQIHRQ